MTGAAPGATGRVRIGVAVRTVAPARRARINRADRANRAGPADRLAGTMIAAARVRRGARKARRDSTTAASVNGANSRRRCPK